MNSSENFGSSWSARSIAALSNRINLDLVIAVTVPRRCGWPARQPSPKNSPFSWRATTASLPVLGNHGDLALAVYDVKDSIRRISLAEDISFFRYFAFVLPPSPVG